MQQGHHLKAEVYGVCYVVIDSAVKKYAGRFYDNA